MKRIAMIALAAMALGGCTRSVKYNAQSMAEAGSEKAGMATIVVAQRQKDGFGTAWWQNVEVDGKKVGDIRRGTYVHVNIPPGHHVVDVAYPAMAMATPALGMESEFDAGKTYYFVWEAAGNVLKETLQIRAVSPSEGRASIVGMTDRTNAAKGAGTQ
jgi:hypothetical protein